MDCTALYICPKETSYRPDKELIENCLNIIEDGDYWGSNKSLQFHGDHAEIDEENSFMDFEIKLDQIKEQMKSWSTHHITILGWERDELLKRFAEAIEAECSDKDFEFADISIIIGPHSIVNKEGQLIKSHFSFALTADRDLTEAPQELTMRLKKNETFDECMEAFASILDAPLQFFFGES